MKKWSELKFWKSGECQAALERLRFSKPYCPDRSNLFKALRSVTPDKVRVAVVGQDPYPDPKLATGFAFSVPEETLQLPPTLQNIFKEYEDDLGYPAPGSGNLQPWVDRGVLLWNALPSCAAGRSLSHDWPEWHLLTQELITKLDAENAPVWVFLGGVSRRFSVFANPDRVIELSHPSPRASASARFPFLGSRMFSKVNTLLVSRGLEPLDWRLPDGQVQNQEAAKPNSEKEVLLIL